MDERLVELLGTYGLDERESKILIFLTRNGSTGAGELAKSLDIRRMEAYRLLKRMLDRGLVVSSAGKPIRYQAENLEGVLSLVTDEQRAHVKRMDEAKPELLGLWKQIPRSPRENFEQRFKIVQGREQVYSTISKMLDAASSSVRMILPKNDLVQAYVLGMTEKLDDLARHGIRFELVTEIDSSTLEPVEAFARSGSVSHSEEASRSRLVVVDGSQSLVSLVLDDSKGMKNERDVAIWTDSRDYADMMAGLHRTSFSRGEASETRVPHVKRKVLFGEKVQSVVGVIRTAMVETGWKVASPGVIRGSSGSDFEFAAVLSSPEGERVGLDVVFGSKDSPVEEVVTAAALKKLDIRDASMILLASPAPDEQTIALAGLLGVSVVDGSDPVIAAGDVRQVLTEKD